MNLFKLFSGVFLFTVFFSCSNDFEIAAPFKNIPVVYAFVDVGEEFNFFRIEKGFIDPNVSAETIAQIADSLYYGPEVLIRITNIRTSKQVILDRVNLEDEGFTREDGIFATSPNIGYKLRVADLDLQINEELKLEIIGADDGIITEASTIVVGEHVLTGQPSSPLRFRNDSDVLFGIRSAEQGARFYDLRAIINYDEVNIDNPAISVSKKLEWVIGTQLERGVSSSNDLFLTTTLFRIDGIEFYRFLGNNIDIIPNISRTFTGIDLQYEAGGQEIFDFINIGQANTGITSGQVLPSFTNLSNEGVGIFSSRITTRSLDSESFNLNTETRDSLREGVFTRELNFN